MPELLMHKTFPSTEKGNSTVIRNTPPSGNTHRGRVTHFTTNAFSVQEAEI